PAVVFPVESLSSIFVALTIAVLLSVKGYDGAKGVESIKNAGGMVIAQDEDTSEFFGMPSAAIATGSVDIVLPLALIAPALVGLVQPPPQPPPRPEGPS